MTVTATQGGATAAGMALQVRVLTGAKAPASQNGAAVGAQSATPNLSITPNATGSLLYSAVLLSGSTASSAESGETALFNANNGALGYAFFESASTTTAGTPVLMGSATGTGIAISNAEVVANGGTVSVWSAQPSGLANGGIIATTSGFSPPPGSLLVAMVSTNGAAGTTTVTMSDSYGLTWTNLQQENGGGHGYVGIWVARVPDPLPSLLYVSDASHRGNVANTQTVSYTPQSQKSLIICCGSLYDSTNVVRSISSISDSAGNTWRFALNASQYPPYIGQTVSGQFYNAFIGWTWQDKGLATTYNVNFSGSAFVNMDISEWSGAGSVLSGAAAVGPTSSTTLVGPTVSVTSGSIAVSITNTINGALTTATPNGSDGVLAGSISNEGVINFVVLSGNGSANPLKQTNNPYNFTFANFGSAQDYATAILVLNPRGAPTGSFFRFPASPSSL